MIDSGRVAQLGEHSNDRLGRHVAGGAWGVGTAPKTSDRGVDGGDTELKCELDIFEGVLVGVMQMNRKFICRDLL